MSQEKGLMGSEYVTAPAQLYCTPIVQCDIVLCLERGGMQVCIKYWSASVAIHQVKKASTRETGRIAKQIQENNCWLSLSRGESNVCEAVS